MSTDERAQREEELRPLRVARVRPHIRPGLRRRVRPLPVRKPARSARRREAIQTLIDRGATAGEREAATAALHRLDHPSEQTHAATGRGSYYARDTLAIAALYVETGGVYWDLPDVDPWDEARDARLYAGPWPVVAHPPCARWCALAGFVEHVHGYKRGEDGGTFEAALNAVRTFGGVLEHPANSAAWARYELPVPAREGWTSSLLDGGWTCYVEQGRYGLPNKKGTWLYAYGVELPELRWGYVPDQRGVPGSNKGHGGMDAWRDRWTSGWWVGPESRRPAETRMRRENSSHTPPAFRDVLLDIARSAAKVPA